MAIIYALLDPNDYAVRYVGYALDGPTRLESHMQESTKSRTHKAAWIRSLRNEGQRAVLATLEDLSPDVDWRERERVWIAHMRALGCDLTNATDGGEGGHIEASQTPEARAKRAASNRGQKRSPEARERMRQAALRRGRPSNETRARISAGLRGSAPSAETRSKISAANRGRVRSPETRQRMSLARSGEGGANARLRDQDVVRIRQLLTDGVARREIAKSFGMSYGAVTDIALRRRWKHI